MGQSPVHVSAIKLQGELDGPEMNLSIKIHTLRTISNSSIKPGSYSNCFNLNMNLEDFTLI